MNEHVARNIPNVMTALGCSVTAALLTYWFPNTFNEICLCIVLTLLLCQLVFTAYLIIHTRRRK